MYLISQVPSPFKLHAQLVNLLCLPVDYHKAVKLSRAFIVDGRFVDEDVDRANDVLHVRWWQPALLRILLFLARSPGSAVAQAKVRSTGKQREAAAEVACLQKMRDVGENSIDR